MVAWQQSLMLATAFLRLSSNLLVQRRRNKAAAAKLMRKLLKKQGFPPDVIITDKLRSYDAARLGFAQTTSAGKPYGGCRHSGEIHDGQQGPSAEPDCLSPQGSLTGRHRVASLGYR